jgi:thioredoxin reductase
MNRYTFIKGTSAFTVSLLVYPFQLKPMKEQSQFDVLIIGGSYAGLSAAMALGRAMRKVLVVDSGKPCNRQTPQSHNLITQDGATPAQIAAIAKEQVLAYPTVQFKSDMVTAVSGSNNFFIVETAGGKKVKARKALFAAGIKDIMPPIDGFEACWGISVIHCPYCHGYEYRNEITGVLGNGDSGFETAKLISNWTKHLTLFTNGESSLTTEQAKALKKHNIQVVESKVMRLVHQNGYLSQIILNDNSGIALKALYAKVPFVQHTELPQKWGCEMTEQGYIKVDAWQKTSLPGVYACGDSATVLRSVSNAIFTGTVAGAGINKELIDESF